MKTLLLVDGSSYLYRAFHALPDLRNARGEPTGAIYGVLNMLRRLAADYKPDYLACVFDAKGRTFRDDWYAEYKAHRPAMPEDLARQIEPLHQAVAALGWPLVMIAGVEADDVIGTLARQATVAGMRCVVSTGDKDLAQLVNPSVILINTMTNERLDEAGVEAKFGVPPRLMLDYLSLVGDSVDNVPGVEKVGPKTALKWLSQYGSLDGVIAHAQEIGGVVGENLRRALPWLPQARKLLTVYCDVPLPVKPEELLPQAHGEAELTGLFQRFGFKSWLKAAAPASAAAAEPGAQPAHTGPEPRQADNGPDPIARRYDTIFDEAQMAEWLKLLDSAALVAFDTETTGLDPLTAQLVGMSFCAEPGRAAYLPLAHNYAGAPPQLGVARALALLRPWLEDAHKPKLGQNLKYDQHVLANHGVALRGVVHDTLLESYVLESHLRHDLGALAERHLHLDTISYDDVTGKGAQRIGFEQVSVERATEYSAEDADVTLRLHQCLYPKVQAEAGLEYVYRQIELPAREVLFRMERSGVLIDVALLEAQSRELGQKMMELEHKAYREAGQPFNLNSPKQIGEIFFERLKLPVLKKTPSGAPSTDEEVLERLAADYPLPKTLLEYRALTKLKSTYTDKLPRMVNPVTGRVHTNYAQATAVTGRLASTDPNLQNIPVRTPEGRRIREAFIAPAGCVIVSADYSQIELRIMAHISRDENLLRAFAAGEDVHRATAAEIFNRSLHEVTPEERRYAKVINFGLIYGMSAFGVAQNLGLERATAQAYIDSYFTRYPGVAHYMQQTREQARERGYVETVFGRRLWLAEIRAANSGRRQGAERAAINAPMQGTAADLIKLSMIAVQNWLDRENLSAKLVMQVHDELVLEVPQSELTRVREELPQLMSGVARLAVPLVVDVGAGANWEQAH
ncbi:MAG: DNA polymerase I [Betaproteobacteria bacterium RIFCSPLOWO2_12_FULL_66_14]|nr:MAG: DNA polymerase I [Betaproteobacteria bacterium RIFCSPLOWO2_12_FULL_66_14]